MVLKNTPCVPSKFSELQFIIQLFCGLRKLLFLEELTAIINHSLKRSVSEVDQQRKVNIPQHSLFPLLICDVEVISCLLCLVLAILRYSLN